MVIDLGSSEQSALSKSVLDTMFSNKEDAGKTADKYAKEAEENLKSDDIQRAIAYGTLAVFYQLKANRTI